MKRLVSPRVGLAVIAVLALGSTIGWVDSAGGTLDSAGGATLSFTMPDLAITTNPNPQNMTVLFFVQGPDAYRQETVFAGSLSSGQVLVPNPLAIPDAPTGTYAVGLEIEPSGGGVVSFSAVAAMSSSRGGAVTGATIQAGPTPNNDQGVGTFVYRNKLIPVPLG